MIKRALLAGLLLMAPIALVLAAAGCEQEVRTVEKKQTVQETEPQMVSPGTEVVE